MENQVIHVYSVDDDSDHVDCVEHKNIKENQLVYPVIHRCYENDAIAHKNSKLLCPER